MNFDEPQALTYGTSRGAGWRLDCLGDLRVKSDNPYFQPEMLDIYPQQVVRAGIQEVWQQAAGIAGGLWHGFGVEERSLRCELHS